MGDLKCPDCGITVGKTNENWECRICKGCGLLVFKK